MADPRTSFAVLEDSSTQAGLPLHKVLEGDASASKNALAGLVAKDGSGNLKYLKVNTAGELIVTDEGSSVCKFDQGEVSAGSATLTEVASITLTASKTYKQIGFVFSCRRDALFQVIQVDDVTETVLAEVVVGAGAYTASSQLHCLEFTAGATGTQALKVKAKNFEALSSLRATVTAHEIV